MLDNVSNIPLLQVEQVTKRFRRGTTEVIALAGIDLTVGQGEFIAIMGASGSGKSTLLHLMGGLTSPDSGRVIVEGRDLAQLSDYELTLFRRRRVGLVFQSLNLIPSLTAEENVLLPIYASGTQLRREEVHDLFDYLGIAERRQQRPDCLSGGEQQRVAIARALVTDPAIVLADEPTGSLDSHNSLAICRLLRRLNDEQRRTIVCVTHEPGVAIWADRVVILKDGAVCTGFATADFDGPQSLALHYQGLTSPTKLEVHHDQH